jgi:hypothetical protein
MIVFRADYTMDVFTGVVTAWLVCGALARVSIAGATS